MQRAPEAPEREPQLQNYLSRAECAVKELSESVASLEQRLTPVLRVEPPTPSGMAQPKEIDVLVPAADRLRGVLADISSIDAHVRSIRGRIEA